jgi:hypothetical protein
VSRVYFHTSSGEAVLSGAERAWCNSVVDSIASGVLGENAPFGDRVERIRQLIDPGHWLIKNYSNANSPVWWSHFKLALNGYSGSPLSWKGQPLSSFSFGLNTALLLGNDTVKLMAYLHGQCEIHGWIAGKDRRWYAGLIQGGRASGLLRANAGWEEVQELLLSRDDGPVVTSYSVTDSFPNPDIAGIKPESEVPGIEEDAYAEMYARWESLSAKQQWHRGFQGIIDREKPGSSYRWSPAVFAEQKFGHELSFYDLLADTCTCGHPYSDHDDGESCAQCRADASWGRGTRCPRFQWDGVPRRRVW